MMLWRAWMLALVACGTTDKPTDTDTDTDAAGLTDRLDTDRPAVTDRPEPTDPPDVDTDRPAWDTASNAQITTWAVAPIAASFDLDGDGARDNALAPFARLIDPLLAGILADAAAGLVIQVATIGPADAAVEGALSLLPTTAGDGTCPVAGALVDADGLAHAGVPIALSEGAYEAIWLDQALVIGGRTLSTATALHVRGAVSADGQSGAIGFGVRADALVAALDATGNGELGAALAQAADLDTDGDGVDDAISAALTWSAPGCALSATP